MSEQRVMAGQVWTRKRDGSQLIVEAVDGTFDDVTYRRLYPSGDRSRRQQIFGYNLRRFYDLSEATR